jgi:Protein of unknown function (DUF3147)
MTATEHGSGNEREVPPEQAGAYEQQDESEREPTLADRIAERPKLDLGRARQTPPRYLLIRFGAGAATSVVSGTTTIVFGPRVGGVLLAFPAILAASLTLIEEQDNSIDAREDARGAIAGGCALAIFALAAELTLGHMSGALALMIAAAAWVGAAFALYFTLWWRRPPQGSGGPTAEFGSDGAAEPPRASTS